MLNIGTLKSFNSTDYRAEVQLAGSMAAYLDNIPVARNIASDQMTVGRHVILAIPGGNPRDACVIAVWDGAAGGGGGGGGITDHGELTGLADNDHSQYLYDQQKYFHDCFQTLDAWNEEIIGTGSRSWYGIWQVRIYTGTTANSEYRFYTALLPNWPSVGKKWRLELQAIPELTASVGLLFLVQWQVGRPPPLTCKHVGWKVINKRIWASTGDGTTEKATDTGIDFTGAWTSRALYIHWYASGEIRFYIDTVLRATHTTNLPQSGDNHYIYISTKNTSAVNMGFLLRDIICR